MVASSSGKKVLKSEVVVYFFRGESEIVTHAEYSGGITIVKEKHLTAKLKCVINSGVMHRGNKIESIIREITSDSRRVCYSRFWK